MKELVLEEGYFWEGFSNDIKNFLKSCPKEEDKDTYKANNQ